MKDKKIDAVKMMRTIRDKLSQRYSNMTIEEQIADMEKNFKDITWESRNTDKIKTAIRS